MGRMESPIGDRRKGMEIARAKLGTWVGYLGWLLGLGTWVAYLACLLRLGT